MNSQHPPLRSVTIGKAISAKADELGRELEPREMIALLIGEVDKRDMLLARCWKITGFSVPLRKAIEAIIPSPENSELSQPDHE